MDSKGKFLFRLFIVFFTASISTTIISCEVVNTYGLLGEIKSSTVARKNRNNTEESLDCLKEMQW